MHEASLINNLLNQLDELASAHGDGCITEIRIEAGPLAGVEPMLLAEAFRRLRGGTVAADAELIVDTVGLTCRCRRCGSDYVTDKLEFFCPSCDSGDVLVIAGDTVVLHSFTLAEYTQKIAS
jgi:hydrogenase nickel incorporation protein HypA/HybF